jgi:exonuclease III
MSSLRIATWNIGGGFVSSSMENRFDSENLSYFTSELEKLNGDVICLQEVHLPLSQHQPDQATRLSKHAKIS